MKRESANSAIDSMIIGRESAKYRHVFIDGNATPSCDVENKILYSAKFGSIVNAEDDVWVRGANEHECGHARLTPKNKDSSWSKLKGDVVNCLEDVRTEYAISQLSQVVENDIREYKTLSMARIAKSLELNPEQARPIDIALISLLANEKGYLTPLHLSGMAKKYFDSAKDIFAKWRTIPRKEEPIGYLGVPPLADEVIKAFKEVAKEELEQEEDDNEDENNTNNNQFYGNDSSQDKNSNDNSDNKNQSNSQDKTNDDSKDMSDKSQNTSDTEEAKRNSKPKNGDYKPEVKKNISSEAIDKKIKEDFIGQVAEKIIEEKMQKIQKQSLEYSGGYTSDTSCDEFVQVKDNVEEYERSRSRISSYISILSRYTEEALKHSARCRQITNLERGKIDKRKLTSLSKSLTKQVFYKQHNGIDLDVSCTLLIDESGSIGTMASELRALTIAFAEVFQKIGIKFEILGFTSMTSTNPNENGREDISRIIPIKMKVYKPFNQSYMTTKYRLGNITHEYQNVDGESLLYAYKRLNYEHSKRKIIFVLSDGVPMCCRNDYLLCGHLKEVIENIRATGTEIYGFGIGTKAPEEYYGKKHFVFLHDINELGNSFFREFKEIISKPINIL